MPCQIVMCRVRDGGGDAAGPAAPLVLLPLARVLRSLSVTRRTWSALASSGWRKISDSRPTFVASRIFCASSALTSSVTALAMVACCGALASDLIDGENLDELQDDI